MGGMHVPNPAYQYNNGLRYVDWVVSVPLLTVELVGISVLRGARALRARAVLVVSTVLMIVTGYLGEDILGDRGQDDGALLLWGAISTVPFLVAYVLIFRICAESARELPAGASRTMRNIGYLFALTWGVYPLAYLVQVLYEDSPAWGVTRQLSFSLATVAAKVGFGVLAHEVATLRTAYDVASGEQSHEEDVWLSSSKLASARPALGEWLEHSDLEHSDLPSGGEDGYPDARRGGPPLTGRPPRHRPPA